MHVLMEAAKKKNLILAAKKKSFFSGKRNGFFSLKIAGNELWKKKNSGLKEPYFAKYCNKPVKKLQVCQPTT